VVITDTATVTFEATADGSNWVSVACTSIASTSGASSTTATASGVYQCPVAGMGEFRARISSFTGGTVTVKGITTLARRNGAGSGGGSGIVVAEEDGNPSVSGVTTLTVPDGLLTDDGSGAVSLASPSTPTLDNVFDQGKTIDGANSVANAVRIGDGTTPICLYTDATLGPQVRPCTDADTKTVIPTNFNWCLYDIEATSCIETVDPDGASTLAMWTYATAYRPKKSVWFGAGSLSTDGTQCAAPAEVTIGGAGGPKIWTVICAENDASSIYWSFKSPDNWDAGTFTVDHVYIQTAADTGSMLGELSAQCHNNGEAVDTTWGSVVELDDAAVTGSNKNDMITSTAVTPAGTCAAGDMIYFRWQYDATANPTTAAATLNHVGFRVEYSETSRSQ
jgi:hypothetical protein